MQKDGVVLRIMTSNVWGNGEDNPIANRDDNLANVYKKYAPDILGMQEVSPIMRRESVNIFQLLAPNYEEVHADLGVLTNNFTPLVYRKDKFIVLEQGFHLFNGLNDFNSKSITWAVFERMDDQKRFAVCNIHFYWKSDEAGKAARVSNSRELLSTVNQITDKYDVPVFCIGDFNCSIESEPLVELIKAGFIDSQKTASLKTSHSSAYHPYPMWDDTSKIYTKGVLPSGTYEEAIDHLFFKGDAITIMVYDAVVCQEALDSSDHCPVYVDSVIS